jgi:3-oxoadipate enol-lactonase
MAKLGWQMDGPDDASVLVLGSSLGTTRQMWLPQVGELSQRFRVLRYDHRGHGASEVVAGAYTIDELGSDVLEMLDSAAPGVDRVHYAGLSLAGMIGIWLATHAPDRIDRLAVVCTTTYLPPASAWAERAAAVLRGGMETIADSVVARWFTPGFAATSPDVVAGARAMLVGTSPVGYAGCCAAIEHMDQRADVGKIGAPTLVISAADDLSIPPDHGRALAAAVPGARFELVPGAHIANMESSAAVTDLLTGHFMDSTA